MGQMIGIVMYLFTLVATFALLAGVPLLLVSGMLERRRRVVGIAVAMGAGFVVGGAAAWLLWFRPAEWGMGFWETLRAGVDSETYGHAVESVAERLVLAVLFVGDVAALAAGAVIARVAQK